MPELPEADRICRQIGARCAGKTIGSVEVLRGPFLRESDIVGRTIREVRRRGKCPIFILDGGPPLVSRLGMSGYWDFEDEPWTFDYVEGPRTSRASDVRARIGLASGEVLRYHDSRMFGRLETMDVPQMGPDVIRTDHSWNDITLDRPQFIRMFSESDLPIKAFLMDQQSIAGIGNIYSSEILHAAGFLPHATGKETYGKEFLTGAVRLWRALQSVLETNLGEISYSWLKVYRRKMCGTCSGPIVRTELMKRVTFHCPACQR